MPIDDSIRFVYKDFCNKTKKIVSNVYQHPDAIQTLLKTLADNRSLTVLQYDHIIKYLTSRREIQRKAEIGEDEDSYMDTSSPNNYNKVKSFPSPMMAPSSSSSVNKEDDLQKKILEILNKKPLIQELAKRAEVQSKQMTTSEKEELKSKLMNDDKIKAAMAALRNSKKFSK